MKVLFVAVFSKNSNNVSQSESFERLGYDLIKYDFRARNGDREKEIVKLTKEHQPECVVFSKCNELKSSVVDECNKYSKTVLWYMDPVNSNFKKTLIEKIQRCSKTYCSIYDAYTEAKKYSDNVEYLPEGFDATVDYPFDLSKTYDVSFIGNLRGERATYHREFLFHNFTNVYREEHAKAVSSTKINLNFTDGGTSDRTYKILASRGFLLTQTWSYMEKEFEDGKHLVTFKDQDELREKIKYYLENEEEREKIALCGYNEVQKYNRDNWVRRVTNVRI
jgi:spore maturation protein CgeB